MTANAAYPTAPSPWTTVLEASLFVFPVVVGLLLGLTALAGAVATTTGDPGGSSMGLEVGVVLLLFVLVGLALALVAPVALYLDASALNELDIEWEPEPALYAVLGFLFSGLVTLHYLYKRHQYVVDPDTWDGWWTVVAAFLVVGAVAVAALFVAPTVGGVAFALAALLFGLTPVALYKDAAHVRSTDSDWRPNPVNYYLAAVFGWFLLVVVPVSVYYLFRRNQHVGLF